MESVKPFSMLPKSLLLIACSFPFNLYVQSQTSGKLSINGFTNWLTGRDSATIQIIPMIGSNASTTIDNSTVAHAKFKVAKYGELSFPVKPSDAVEALRVDISKSRFIKTYLYYWHYRVNRGGTITFILYSF